MKSDKKKASPYFTLAAVFSVSIAAAVFTVVSMKMAGLKMRPMTTESGVTFDATSAAEISVNREGLILPDVFTLVSIGVFPKQTCKSLLVDVLAVGDVTVNTTSTLLHKPCEKVIHPIEVKVTDGGYGLVHFKIEYESDKGRIRAVRTFRYFTASTDLKTKEKMYPY